MKKILSLLLIGIMVLGCSSTQTEQTNTSNDDGFFDWNEEIEFLDNVTMSDLYQTMASKNIDMDAWQRSEIGIFNLQFLNREFTYTGDEDPASIQYWERLGLKKMVFDTDDEDHVWAMYVPLSYYEEENNSKKYPIVFIWHGHENPILDAEQYGYLEEAAMREYIAVIPWAKNDDDYLSETDRLYQSITDEYRIDTGRVYSTGFSKGGQTSLSLALERSDYFAAVSAGGAAANGKFYTDEGELELTGRGPLTQKDFDNAGQSVPVLICAGDSDVYNTMPYDTEEKVWAVNEWLKFEGIDHEQSFENSKKLLENSEDEVEKAIGLDFDNTKTIYLDGHYRVGEFYDASGTNMLSIINVENHLHSTSRGFARLTFDYFDQFSRDVNTGKLIVEK